MSGMQIIKKTQELWGISPNLPRVLCSTCELNKSRQGEQIRSNVCSNCKGKECHEHRKDRPGAEITSTSYYYREFE